MKKIIIAIVIIALLIVIGGYLYINFTGEQKLSSEQKEIVDTLGWPQRFTLAYLPQGEGDDAVLARNEIWSYPEHQQEVTFIAGEILSTDDIEADGDNISYSDLKPEDFEFNMDYDQVVAAIGSEEVEPVNLVGELYIEGEVETFMSDHVIFAIEYGHLTFIQTVGVEN